MFNSQNIRSRVAIYARKQANLTYCQKTDLTSNFDIIIIDVSNSNINIFQIINIYNEKNLDLDSNQNNYIIKKSFQYIQLLKKTLIADDFNTYHNWWNSLITNFIRIDLLIT